MGTRLFMQPTPLRNTPRRLSLTWRVIVPGSLLLLVLVVLFVCLGQYYLTRQMESNRLEHHEHQQREIGLALRRSSDTLRQLAGLLASSPALGSALENDDSAALAQLVGAQWPMLQLEVGVDNIFVYDQQGDELAHFDHGDDPPFFPARRWVEEALSSEVPLTRLRCALACHQFAAVPVLQGGESQGVVIFSRDLAEMMREVKVVSNSEIALMVTGNDLQTAAPGYQQIADWDGVMVALTRPEQTLPILRAAAANVPIQQLVSAPYSVHRDNRQLEVSAVYMWEDGDWRSAGYFLLIADTTLSMMSIQAATRTLLLVGLVGGVIAELLLLLILLGPVSRLRRVSALLPSLARGEFERVEGQLSHTPKHLHNEIDVLEESTRALAQQLHGLETDAKERSAELSSRIKELARERDFASSLLDTAQVFIVAQDHQGHIRLANSYTCHTLGVSERALLGRPFIEVFNRVHPVSDTFAEPTAAAPGPALPEESTFETRDKRHATVVWSHAPLNEADTGGLSRISVGLDITERKSIEARLGWLAERDPTTELYNRRYFQEALGLALDEHTEVAVLLLDLDRFREINELCGHHAGDALLKEIAFTLSANLGQRSTIARLGGDEFALLMTDIQSEQAVSAARYVLQLINTIDFSAAGRQHHVSASVGIALYPQHGNSAEDLLASADIAMYKAKEQGEPDWHLLSMGDSAKSELQERVYWTERVRQALKKDEFELWVQPIVCLKDGSIKHFEALIRLRNADQSLVGPEHFICIAEQSGLITQIDRWVIRESLTALGVLQQRGISLALNLSGQSLHDHGLSQYLTRELQTHRVDPHHLILEITETAAITDFSVAHNVLQKLRDLGCKTALDDFGVGFSSFHYLGKLPVDYIKIDGSFIRNLLTQPDSQTIVKAIAELARGFGKQTIAEFVDQPALLPLLRTHGIHYAQGYHLGKPTPLAALLDDAARP
ncbi:EAL domain-containing protein [Halomonas sp. HNIBRBA4712]|uniref:bifunctional diguanylate cyclase/phosphodiesterase n=1 Tax=Halomonas sp. HNIBRBA4712 TaxID=3373087 RepID=UPI00374606CB